MDDFGEETSEEDKIEPDEVNPKKPIFISMAGDFNARTGSNLDEKNRSLNPVYRNIEYYVQVCSQFILENKYVDECKKYLKDVFAVDEWKEFLSLNDPTNDENSYLYERFKK